MYTNRNYYESMNKIFKNFDKSHMSEAQKYLERSYDGEGNIFLFGEARDCAISRKEKNYGDINSYLNDQPTHYYAELKDGSVLEICDGVLYQCSKSKYLEIRSDNG